MVDIVVPSPGESITEVTLGQWHKKDGDWVETDEVLVDIGYKSEGVIPLNELSIRKSVNVDDEVQLGEMIDALVMQKEDQDGRLILSKKRARFEKAWKRIEAASLQAPPPLLTAEDYCYFAREYHKWKDYTAGQGNDLIKNFKITERFGAQFRAESLNAMNHPNLFAPNTTPTNTAFGTVTGQDVPRSWQFALRVTF